MKKILTINSSGRSKGSGEIILRLCEKYLPKDKYQVKNIALKDFNIQGCTGCLACVSKKQFCHIKDELKNFIDIVLDADIVIICAPVYIFGAISHVKRICDRLLPMQELSDLNNRKPSGMIITASKEGWEGSAIRDTSAFLFGMGCYVKDYLLCYTHGPLGILKDDTIGEKLQKFLDNVIDENKKSQQYKNQCPVCFGDTFKIIDEKTVNCPVCDINAEICEDEKGETVLNFESSDYKNTRISSHSLVDNKDKWMGQFISKEYIRKILLKRKELLG